MRRLIPIVALIALLATPGVAQSALPLGLPNLKERSTTRVLAPGVRLTRIVRGHRDGRERWTVDVMVVRGRDAARRFARRVHARGFDARIIKFYGPLGPRRIRYRVFAIRSGDFNTEKRAARRERRLNSAGFKNTNVVHTSDDGTRRTTGPWRLRILRIKPRQLGGARLAAVLANDRILGREKPTSMAARTNATAGVNAGYFVVEGAGEGDLAGTLAIDGALLSEPLNGRTNFVLPDVSGAGGRLAQLSFSGDVTIDGAKRLLDGINRVRGEIRSCGGTGGDRPTQRPFHDVTCTDESELVHLTPSFGANTATKPGGVEVVVRSGMVTQVIEGGGSTPIPADGYVLSGSGDAADFLRLNAQPGDRPGVRADVLERGLPFDLTERSVVNGGPALVRDGRFFVRAAAEGFVHPNDPSFYFNFGIRRNPRTLAGIRPDGTILLVVADGRQPRWSVGLSFAESADVLRSLGARQGMNLDGGGSSAMTLGGRLLGRPSDDTGERPVGDGLFILP
jgi:Phosphodiester glycosidase